MPSPHPVLSEAEARRIVGDCGFRSPVAAASPGRVGIELEWLPVERDNRGRPARHETVGDVVGRLGPLPGASTVTFEPGGQLELSSPAMPGLGACDVLGRDLGVVTAALADVGRRAGRHRSRTGPAAGTCRADPPVRRHGGLLRP